MVSPAISLGRLTTGQGAGLALSVTVIDQTQQGIRSVNRSITGLEGRLKKLGLSDQLSRQGAIVARSFSNMATGAVVLTGAIATLGNSIGRFQKEISGVAAIIGAAARSEVTALAEEAIELSEQFDTSAEKIAAGMKVIAQTGASMNEVLAATRPILELSTSTMESFELAARLTIRTINAFGLELGRIEDVTRVVTNLQFAVNQSVNTLDSLNNALKFSAPFAKQLAIEMEDLISVFQLTANAGLEAGIAGRSFGQALQLLLRSGMRGARAETRQLAGALREVIDTGGTMADLVRTISASFGLQADTTVDLSRELRDLSDAQLDQISSSGKSIIASEKAIRLVEVFGARGARVFSVLLGQADQLDEFRTGMELQIIRPSEQAQVAMDNLVSQTQLAFQKIQAGILRSDFGEEILEEIDKAVEGGELFEGLGETVADFFDQFSGDFIGNVVTALEQFVDIMGTLAPIMGETAKFVGAFLEAIGLVSKIVPASALGAAAAFAILNKVFGITAFIAARKTQAIQEGTRAIGQQVSAENILLTITRQLNLVVESIVRQMEMFNTALNRTSKGSARTHKSLTLLRKSLRDSERATQALANGQNVLQAELLETGTIAQGSGEAVLRGQAKAQQGLAGTAAGLAVVGVGAKNTTKTVSKGNKFLKSMGSVTKDTTFRLFGLVAALGAVQGAIQAGQSGEFNFGGALMRAGSAGLTAGLIAANPWVGVGVGAGTLIIEGITSAINKDDSAEKSLTDKFKDDKFKNNIRKAGDDLGKQLANAMTLALEEGIEGSAERLRKILSGTESDIISAIEAGVPIEGRVQKIKDTDTLRILTDEIGKVVTRTERQRVAIPEQDRMPLLGRKTRIEDVRVSEIEFESEGLQELFEGTVTPANLEDKTGPAIAKLESNIEQSAKEFMDLQDELFKAGIATADELLEYADVVRIISRTSTKGKGLSGELVAASILNEVIVDWSSTMDKGRVKFSATVDKVAVSLEDFTSESGTLKDNFSNFVNKFNEQVGGEATELEIMRKVTQLAQSSLTVMSNRADAAAIATEELTKSLNESRANLANASRASLNSSVDFERQFTPAGKTESFQKFDIGQDLIEAREKMLLGEIQRRLAEQQVSIQEADLAIAIEDLHTARDTLEANRGRLTITLERAKAELEAAKAMDQDLVGRKILVETELAFNELSKTLKSTNDRIDSIDNAIENLETAFDETTRLNKAMAAIQGIATEHIREFGASLGLATEDLKDLTTEQLVEKMESFGTQIDAAAISLALTADGAKGLIDKLRQSSEEAIKMRGSLANANRSVTDSLVSGAEKYSSFLVENGEALGLSSEELATEQQKLKNIQAFRATSDLVLARQEFSLRKTEIEILSGQNKLRQAESATILASINASQAAIRSQKALAKAQIPDLTAKIAQLELEVANDIIRFRSGGERRGSFFNTIQEAEAEVRLTQRLLDRPPSTATPEFKFNVTQRQKQAKRIANLLIEMSGLESEVEFLQSKIDSANVALDTFESISLDTGGIQQQINNALLEQAIIAEDTTRIFKLLQEELGISIDDLLDLTDEELLKFARQIAGFEEVTFDFESQSLSSAADSLGAALLRSRDELVDMGFAAANINSALESFNKFKFLSTVSGFLTNFESLAQETGADIGLLDTIQEIKSNIVGAGSVFLDDLLNIADPRTLSEIFAKQNFVEQNVNNNNVINLQAELNFPEGITPADKEAISRVALQAVTDAVTENDKLFRV